MGYSSFFTTRFGSTAVTHGQSGGWSATLGVDGGGRQSVRHDEIARATERFGQPACHCEEAQPTWQSRGLASCFFAAPEKP